MLVVFAVLGFVGFQAYDSFFGGTKPVKYDSEAADRLLKTLAERPALSDDDAKAKTKVLTYLPKGQPSGIVYQAPTFRVEYLKSMDVFLVEILTTDVDQAKKDAAEWFFSEGLSHEGTCNAGIMFYLNGNVAEIFKKADNYKFNPLPPSC